MLFAEKQAGKRYSKQFQWSPTLKQAVQAYRFWWLKLKQVQFGRVSLPQLEKYHREAFLQLEVLEIMDKGHIIAPKGN